MAWPVTVRLFAARVIRSGHAIFTGSRPQRSVRQRALKMGYTLNEYSWRIGTEKPVPQERKKSTRTQVGLHPSELRENLENRSCWQPRAAQTAGAVDIQGDVTCTPSRRGRNTIEEMAEARASRISYMAITDHSKTCLRQWSDDERAHDSIERIRAAGRMNGIRSLPALK